MATVREWLAGLGLAQYADIFAANDIDLEVARLLDDGDLEKLGLSLGHRRLLLRAAAALPPAERMAPRTETAREAVLAAGPERRQLTVMFCDLADSTGLSAKLDPEDMQKIISAYQRACATVIEQAQGYVAKYMGDGVLAYFGYPRARADAAERAVHAGLGIVQAVARSAAVVPLAVRVGIATGEVVVGEQIGIESSRERAVVGDAPNLAARLQAAARPGQVLVAELTHRLTERKFVWGQPQRLPLKGFGAPTSAWEALAESTLSEAPAAAADASVRPLIGRKSELSLLRDRLELAAGGDAQVVLLIGEAGIGKSAMASALVALAQEEDISAPSAPVPPFTRAASSARSPVRSNGKRGSSGGTRPPRTSTAFTPGSRATARIPRPTSRCSLHCSRCRAGRTGI